MLGSLGGAALIGGGLGLIGGIIQGDAAKSAANTSADAQRYAADQAAAAAKFTPYSVTTGFGSSNFGTDPTTGQPTAGYTLNPQLQAIRDRTLTQAGAYDPTQYAQYAQPLFGGSQRLFGLANQLLPSGGLPTGPSAGAMSLQQQYANAQQGLLPTSYQTGNTAQATSAQNQYQQFANALAPTSYQTGPTAGAQALAQQYQNAGQGYLAQSPEQAAQNWMQQQQNLLAPGQEQQLSSVRNQQFQTGRSGLGVGGTSAGGLQQTNPELAAYYNSIANTNRGLSAQAQQQGLNQQTAGLNFLNQGLTTQQQSEATQRANMLQNMGLSASYTGQALSTQQQDAATQRANMLQNLGLSLNYGAQGLATGTASEQQQLANYYQQLNAGTGLFGSSAAVLGQVPALTTAGYTPLSTQLGLAGQIEGYGQGALDIGAQLGGRSATAGANVANSLLTGGLSAAKTQQTANAYSPVGSTLQGFANSPALNSWMQNTMNNSGGMGLLNSSTSSQDYMNKIGATSSGAFSGGGSAGDYANEWWMSDIRVKENIKLVGRLNSGLNVYTYEYKPEFKDLAGHGSFTGVMAQEVEKLIPKAVATMNNGYKAVNYSLVY